MRHFRFGDDRGFTLIELMIVVVIIGILAAIAIPRFGAVSEKATETEATETEMTGSEMTGSEMTETEMTGSEAAGSEMTETEMAGSEMMETEMTGSEMTETEMTGSEAAGSEMTETEMTGSEMKTMPEQIYLPERSYDDEKGVYSTSTSGTGFEGDANAKYWSFATSQTSDGDMNDTWSLTDTTQTAMFTDS